jgi:hypothetical protein
MEQLQQGTAVSAPATIAVSSGQPDYRMLVLTRRLKLPGLLETMTDQAPEVARVMAKHGRSIRIQYPYTTDWSSPASC